MLYRIFAIIVFVIFYLIYYIKMLIQKKQGIKTKQIGSHKEKEIHRIEMLMSIATLLAPLSQIISVVLNWSWLPNSVRLSGFIVGIIGDIVFLIAIITMKKSWRAGIPSTDKTELIENGIYKWSRNPAFLGFDLMYIGICLLFCNFATIVCSFFAMIMLHLQILQEEKYLVIIFKDEYINYKNKVLRYLGRKINK